MTVASALAARAIEQVRAGYGRDLDRIELLPAGDQRETLARTYRAIYAELGRAAVIAETGEDRGDRGGFGATINSELIVAGVEA